MQSLPTKNRSKLPQICYTTVPLRRSLPSRFRHGDLVEIASFREGFIGSYYEGTVIADLPNGNYLVEYLTLVTEDYSQPLRESISAVEVRPRPPPAVAADYRIHDVVDVFANDGWWVGRITGNVGDNFSVYFGSTREEITYAKDLLRIHLNWIGGKWIY